MVYLAVVRCLLVTADSPSSITSVHTNQTYPLLHPISQSVCPLRPSVRPSVRPSLARSSFIRPPTSTSSISLASFSPAICRENPRCVKIVMLIRFGRGVVAAVRLRSRLRSRRRRTWPIAAGQRLAHPRRRRRRPVLIVGRLDLVGELDLDGVLVVRQVSHPAVRRLVDARHGDGADLGARYGAVRHRVLDGDELLELFRHLVVRL